MLSMDELTTSCSYSQFLHHWNLSSHRSVSLLYLFVSLHGSAFFSKSELVVTFFLSPILKTRIISFLSTWDGTGRKYPASAGHPVGSSHQVTPLLDGADLTPTRSCPSISSGLDLFSSPNSLAFFRPIVSESSEVCKVTPPWNKHNPRTYIGTPKRNFIFQPLIFKGFFCWFQGG